MDYSDNEYLMKANRTLYDRIEELEAKLGHAVLESRVQALLMEKVAQERDCYLDALRQIRDFPHAPDAWLVAKTALEKK